MTLKVIIKVLRVLIAVEGLNGHGHFKIILCFVFSSKQDLINLMSEMKSSLLIEVGTLKEV